MTEKNGVVDALGIDLKEHTYMSSCYQLLLQVFHALFAWFVISPLYISHIYMNGDVALVTEPWPCVFLRLHMRPGNAVTLFSFRSGFSQLENRSLLKAALGILVERLKETDSDLTIEELVR